jgi:hypothetical protein
MSEALGEALLYLRTDDRALDAGIARAKGKSDQLGVSFDNTSEKADDLGKSMDRAGQSANRFGDVQTKVTTQTSAQRAGISQLMMQVNDMGTMYSLGARPMQIFSSQIGQVTQAIQLASGGTSRFAAIMGSPWTMAISTAAIVLVPLIAGLFETEEAADKAGKANETWAEKLDASKHSVDEVRAALREYNAEQRKATETTLQAAQAAATASAKELKRALALRQVLAAQLAGQRAAANASAGQGTGGAAGSYIAGQADVTGARIRENEAEIAKLTQGAQDAIGDVADELAKLDTDPTEKARLGFSELRKEARRTIKDVEQLRQRLGEINRAEKKAIDEANASKRTTRSSSASDASAASVGDMTALIKSLFPGAVITSTTGGKHTKGSDHYKKRAVDFAVPGMMGAGDTPEVQRRLEEAGVTIRRNERGTQQFFGPGRSASKPGDHDDHYHLAWSGSASPEEAQRRREQAEQRKEREAEQEARRVERYSRDLAGLQDAALDLQAQLGQTAEERFQLEKQGLEISIAEQKRRIEVNADYTDAERETLLAALERKASLERELLDRRRQEELARQAVEIAQAQWDNERELLEKQAALTDVREERRAIEQKILDESYKQHRLALEATIASSAATEAAKADARDQLGKLDQNKSLDQQRLDRDFESPLDRYRREIVGVGNNLNDEMEKVAISGIERLSDGLADVITNAKSLGSAFKAVAKQIIADLIRIAIQQLVVKALMSAIGGGGGGEASAVMNIGKGASNFAGFFAKGGLIPSGSFGIVGENGPEPIWATDGGVAVAPNSALRSATMGGGTNVSISIPIDATGADAAALGRVQSQLDRLEQELPTTIVRTVQDAGDRRIISPRKW